MGSSPIARFLMSIAKLFVRIDKFTFDPHIIAGQACIRGMRVPVALILNLVANGKTVGEIIQDYPYLEPEDI
ncbi:MULTISPECIES: DUF433 domain-containing protein [unclassified Anabaena]|uniref:DUF433 domain-containing protein n=1 Tax=unclassified Anabaena TaxID=2619674 RepID=UPI0030DD0EFF